MYEHISKYNPTDVDIAPDGTIYIVDGYGKSLVHVYDKNRKYTKTFGGKGKEDGKFDVCHNILVDTRTDRPSLLISDRQNNRLTQYSMDGSFVANIDSDLRLPCAADIYDDLLAVGELGGRVSLYDRSNRLVARIGDDPRDRKKGNRSSAGKLVPRSGRRCAWLHLRRQRRSLRPRMESLRAIGKVPDPLVASLVTATPSFHGPLDAAARPELPLTSNSSTERSPLLRDGRSTTRMIS